MNNFYKVLWKKNVGEGGITEVIKKSYLSNDIIYFNYQIIMFMFVQKIKYRLNNYKKNNMLSVLSSKLIKAVSKSACNSFKYYQKNGISEVVKFIICIASHKRDLNKFW